MLGADHAGVDAWGRNVYATREDPAYQALLRWVNATDTGDDGGAP